MHYHYRSTTASAEHGHLQLSILAVAGSTTYTFTPAAGQCAVPATMSIVITPQVTPAFTQIGPLCQNSTAPALPLSSTNSISGTWSPATINT
jgi:hypothetical protein